MKKEYDPLNYDYHYYPEVWSTVVRSIVMIAAGSFIAYDLFVNKKALTMPYDGATFFLFIISLLLLFMFFVVILSSLYAMYTLNDISVGINEDGLFVKGMFFYWDQLKDIEIHREKGHKEGRKMVIQTHLKDMPELHPSFLKKVFYGLFDIKRTDPYGSLIIKEYDIPITLEELAVILEEYKAKQVKR